MSSLVLLLSCSSLAVHEGTASDRTEQRTIAAVEARQGVEDAALPRMVRDTANPAAGSLTHRWTERVERPWPQESHGNAERAHDHHVALFFGDTVKDGDHGFMVGVDYENRLHDYFGADALGNDAHGLRLYLTSMPLRRKSTMKGTQCQPI